MNTTRRLSDQTTRSRPSLETWAMRDVSMKSLREPKSMSEHTRYKPRTGIIYFGGKRQKGDKLVPGHEDRILHEPTTLYGGVRRYLHDLAAALPRKHMHCIRLAHERVALVHVDVAEIPKTDVNGLHEGTRAHVVQESMFVARGYECRVREPVRARGLGERHQCPGPELPTRRVLMVHRRRPRPRRQSRWPDARLPSARLRGQRRDIRFRTRNGHGGGRTTASDQFEHPAESKGLGLRKKKLFRTRGRHHKTVLEKR